MSITNTGGEPTKKILILPPKIGQGRRPAIWVTPNQRVARDAGSALHDRGEHMPKDYATPSGEALIR